MTERVRIHQDVLKFKERLQSLYPIREGTVDALVRCYVEVNEDASAT